MHPRWPGRAMACAAALLDLVLPVDCAGCGADGLSCCASCRAALRAVPFPAHRSPPPPGLPPVRAALRYDGLPRALLLAYKEAGRDDLSRSLAVPLGDALTAIGRAAGVTDLTRCRLVPVPSRAEARRGRGGDHLLPLARRARRLAGAGAVVPGLRHSRAVSDQAQLGATGRRANLRGALVVRPHLVGRLRGHPLLLLDDVITTGSTLAESARALRAADLDVVGAAVIAATELRRITSVTG